MLIADTGLDTSSPADAGADVGSDAGSDTGPPPDRVVRACDEVVLPGGASGTTEVVGWPLLFATVRGEELVFRAPAVARPTLLSIGSTVVLVQPRPETGFDIPGLAVDCGSFRHGVASGDPRPDAVTLWTRWTGPDPSTESELAWGPMLNILACGTRPGPPTTASLHVVNRLFLAP